MTRKKQTVPRRSKAARPANFPAQKELNARLQTLSNFAKRMQIDCSSDLEKVGNDPVARIGIVARALGVDAMMALSPATNLDELISQGKA